MNNPLEGTKVIGFVVINWDSKQIACDLYEGNRVILPSGKLGQATPETYEKLLALYEQGVQDGAPLRTAYAYNVEHGLNVPEYTADPEAAEKGEKIRAAEEAEARVRAEAEAAAAEAKRLQEEEEQRKRAEAEQREKEEQAKKEREELEQELAAREEQKRRLEEEAKAQEAEKKRLKEEAAQKKKEEAEAKKREAAEKKEAAKRAAAEERLRKKEEKAKRKEERAAETPEERKKGVILIAGLMILMVAIYVGLTVWPKLQKSQGENQPTVENEAATDSKNEYIVIALAKDVAMSQMIQETDIKGVIVSAEQYEKYNSETFINSSGDVQYMALLLWDDKDSVIGQYAATDLKADSLLYDTNVSTQHVVADKTYVEATVNGEDGTYEVEGDVLPGNTDIKIVAVITTDGGEPVQILLSQMKLQDRSLESIFNSAGQNILEQLSEKANGTNEDDTQSQESEE